MHFTPSGPVSNLGSGGLFSLKKMLFQYSELTPLAHCLDSGLYNRMVDQTHPVLASGKLVQQKKMTYFENGSLRDPGVSRELLLPGRRPQAAMYVLLITLIFSIGLLSNSLSNNSCNEEEAQLVRRGLPSLSSCKGRNLSENDNSVSYN